jgi:hypothetical protein
MIINGRFDLATDYKYKGKIQSLEPDPGGFL